MRVKSRRERILALALAAVLGVSGVLPVSAGSTASVYAAEQQNVDRSVTELTAENFPSEILEGETYQLTEDITLTESQQITNLAGTLDGQGHTITLAGNTLADKVSGTVQNLLIKGNVNVTSGYKGSIAGELSGTIQNCGSEAKIQDNWNTVGGLVGTLKGGIVRNCYYAAELIFGNAGIAAYAEKDQTSQVSNCYYLTGTMIDTVAMNASAVTITNSAAKTEEELKSETTTALLNSGMIDTGYVFAVSENDGYPVLKKGAAQISWTVLTEAQKQAATYESSSYTETSWKTLQDALQSANALQEKEEVSQEEINAAAKAITDAIAALKLLPTVKPVALPESVISISSQEDFSKMDMAKGKYFVLTQDITIDSNYETKSFYMNYSQFEGVLDGQGHTITFENAVPVFANLSAGAVVQNISLKGSLSVSDGTIAGPFGTTAYGASILNCRSEITGSNAAGFIGKTGAYMGADASKDRDGVIANCIAVGDTGKGAICNASSSNSGEAIISHCYWLDTLGNGSGAMSEEDMKTLELVEKLNKEKGENGISWGQGSDGYPYFGENQTYTPGVFEWPETEENKYEVDFLQYNANTAITLENSRLEWNPDAVNEFKIAGSFSLKDLEVPEGATVSWGFSKRNPEKSFAVSEEEGELFVYGTGTAVLTATLNYADGTKELLASVAIRSTRQKMTDIKLYIDDTDVTDKTYTVQGSEYKKIYVKAQYEGTEEYQEVSFASFTYRADEAGSKLLKDRMEASSTFSFKESGTAVFTVTAKNQPQISKSVTVTSAYVPVESVVPAISGTKVIHSRNANSDGQESDGRVAFNPIAGSAIVLPANATNAEKVTITSNDPEGTIAYYAEGSKVYVPKQAGTVTFTASVEDTDPQTKETKTISGENNVTFVYKNPLKTIELDEEEKEISVAEGETSAEFEVMTAGELDAEGYEVTEPTLKWTYDKKGIAQIVTTGGGYWKKNGSYAEEDPDYGSYLLAPKYQVMGLSEGTVTATGTPVDNKNEVEPVTVTITVTKGSGAVVDSTETAKTGIASAKNYITELHKETGYDYGDEWLIYALLQEEQEIPQEVKDTYYASLEEEVKKWDADQKPTDLERAALALTSMGKDITNIEGVDLAEKIYNSENLKNGSNELSYALLALDAANIAIPTDAKWSRSEMLAELLKFQNENGGFGLTGKESASVDMTAMALQALAPYQSHSEVNQAIEKALLYLKGQMQEDFGYGTAESNAQVLLALTTLGIDPTRVENGFGTPRFNLIHNLMEYQQADGGFSHLISIGKSQEMSTVQVLQALSAFAGGKTTYWQVNGEHISVMVSILGDEIHDSDKDGKIHAYVKDNLQIWAAKAEYRAEKTATAMDAIDAALAANGMTCEKKYNGTYLAFVTKSEVKLGEYTNGKNSGWKYSLNGEDPGVAATDQSIVDGDHVILHYTDNWEKENQTEEHKHSWDNKKEVQKATCTKAGLVLYACLCGETKTEETPALGHSYGAWITTEEATVFAGEKQKHICNICGASEEKVGKALSPTMKLNAAKLILKIKQKSKAFEVSNLANGDFVKSYKTSNPKVFTVSPKGVLKAGKKAGKAKLTVTLASGYKKTIQVKVQKKTVKLQKVQGLKKQLMLVKGEVFQITAVKYPITAPDKLRYKTADKKIAAVDKKGRITAKKAGKTTITVTAGGKKVSVRVTVKETN